MKKTKMKEINKKFVLIGDGYCGKSTLIAAFYNRKFVEKYTPTIFDTYTVQTDIYRKHVNLEICDSAGQNEFSRVRPLSYPEVDCIILCFSVDSRESSQNLLELWLPEIRHFCSNKIPILLVGCKIDLRLDRTTNRHFLLKQDHLTSSRANSLSQHQNNSISSLHYGLFKTLHLNCCRHGGRPCTCYHSRICATSCLNSIKRKPSNLSNSSSCLITTPTKTTSLSNKDSIIRANRMLLQQQSPTRNSTNTEDSSSSEADVEELQSNTMSNTMSNSSCSLNGQDTYNNSIYRHNQSMLNTLIHQQVEQQCSNSLNSSESDESETIDDQQINHQINNDLIDSLDVNHLPVDLQSSIIEDNDDTSKSQPILIKNFKINNRSKLFGKGYKSFITQSTDDSTRSLKMNNKSNLDFSKKSFASLKDRKMFKNSSLKQKLSTMFSSSTVSSSIYPSKSEKKLSNLFYNRKLSTSSSSLPFSLIVKADHKPIDQPISPFITTEEGISLCSKIGAQAYVECSSKMNIGVDEVFRTALKLSIKHPISMKFNQMDMCSIV